jgi:dephospho-CoA kinase
VDRKALGSLVFGDAAKLAALSAIVWPEIMELTIQALQEGRAGPAQGTLRVVRRLDAATGAVLEAEEVAEGAVGGGVAVVEAAVLLQARWGNRFDEVWGTVVPLDVALERLRARNPLLTEQEARQRVAAAVAPDAVRRECRVVVDTSGTKAQTRHALAQHWNRLVDDLRRSGSGVGAVCARCLC